MHNPFLHLWPPPTRTVLLLLHPYISWKHAQKTPTNQHKTDFFLHFELFHPHIYMYYMLITNMIPVVSSFSVATHFFMQTIKISGLQVNLVTLLTRNSNKRKPKVLLKAIMNIIPTSTAPANDLNSTILMYNSEPNQIASCLWTAGRALLSLCWNVYLFHGKSKF